MKRSTRNIVISKAFRVVDSETRKDLQDRRLQSFEADNYAEAEAETNIDDYEDENDDDAGVSKRKKSSQSKESSISKWSKRPIKSFERILFEQGYSSSPNPGGENYISIAAGSPTTRSIQLCTVCGYIGSYSCSRCGMRYCSIKCQKHHKETRCMKLSL